MRARRATNGHAKVMLLFTVVIVCALAGSWIMFIVSNLGHYLALPWEEVIVGGISVKVPPIAGYLKAGVVYYGGVIGGLAGVSAFALAAGIPVLETMDISAPALALGHAWGRLGCFLAGCCYGRPCGAWEYLCIRFPAGSVAFSDIYGRETGDIKMDLTQPLFPVQIVESLFELMLSLLLAHLYGRRMGKGMVFGAYLFLYGAFRFIIEYFRFDPYRGHLYSLSTSQWISMAAVAAGLAFAIARALGPKKRGKKIITD